MNLITLIEAFNPLQGSVRAGVAGLLFVLVPTLAFWIGRGLVDDGAPQRKSFVLMAGFAVIAALYGLWQTFAGFPSWDARWIADSNYAALNVGRTIGPFGTFSSAAEYGFYLSIGIAIWISFTRSVSRLVVHLRRRDATRGRLIYRVRANDHRTPRRCSRHRHRGPPRRPTLDSTRCRRRWPSSSSRSQPDTSPGPSRTVRPRHSSAMRLRGSRTLQLRVVHGARPRLADLARNSVCRDEPGWTRHQRGHDRRDEVRRHQPEHRSGSIERSCSAWSAWLIAYLAVVITGLGLLYRTAARRRDALATAALAVVLATALEWLNGGQYAIAFLPWLVFGWADRARVLEDEAEQDEAGMDG